MNSQTMLGSTLAAAMLTADLVFQVAVLFLAAGYDSARGGADLVGHVLGFNEPLALGHLRLMADSLTAWGIVSQINILNAPLLAITLLALIWSIGSQGPRSWLPSFIQHSMVFAALVVGFLMRDWALGHRWTGESIVEGELSIVMVWVIWLIAWFPVFIWHLAARTWSKATRRHQMKS